MTGIFVAVLAGLANIDEIVQLTNIGTLFAFVLVCIGVSVLRVKDPGRHRPFRVPGGAFLVPALGAACCIFLMVYLPPASWWRFIGWLVIGASIYAAYGYSSSVLGRKAGRPAKRPAFMTWMAYGFALAGLGLFVIPHDAGLGRLIAEALDSADADHTRSLFGLGLIVVGLMSAVIGAVNGRRRLD
jgi:APA family basic amino acid/polyamine antiporter